MGKEKIRHLFKKNHIEIFKVENPEFPIPKCPTYENKSVTTYSYSHNYGWTQDKKEYKEEKKISPLGFYYIKKVRIHEIGNGKEVNRCIERTFVTYPVPGEINTYIQLNYYTRYDDNIIGNESELRPWDIYPGDNDFSDNMLDALVKEINSFFNLAEAANIKKFSEGSYSFHYDGNKKIYEKDLNEVKKIVFKELFGNEKGPRFQTNEEKILAHGFDLKYSFRKDKEKK